MKRKLLVAVAICLAIFACEKQDDTNPIIETNKVNYFPLTTGSYWVYNTYKIDSLGNEEIISKNDTIEIIGDSIIEGKNYKVFLGKDYNSNIPQKSFYRDSSGYIILANGNIVFSQTNFSETLFEDSVPDNSDAIIYTHTQMDIYEEDVVIPAGTFDSVLNCVLFVDHLQVEPLIKSSLDNLYAPNVGLILKQYYYVSLFEHEKTYYERRLVAYKIED